MTVATWSLTSTYRRRSSYSVNNMSTDGSNAAPVPAAGQPMSDDGNGARTFFHGDEADGDLLRRMIDRVNLEKSSLDRFLPMYNVAVNISTKMQYDKFAFVLMFRVVNGVTDCPDGDGTSVKCLRLFAVRTYRNTEAHKVRDILGPVQAALLRRLFGSTKSFDLYADDENSNDNGFCASVSKHWCRATGFLSSGPTRRRVFLPNVFVYIMNTERRVSEILLVNRRSDRADGEQPLQHLTESRDNLKRLIGKVYNDPILCDNEAKMLEYLNHRLRRRRSTEETTADGGDGGGGGGGRPLAAASTTQQDRSTETNVSCEDVEVPTCVNDSVEYWMERLNGENVTSEGGNGDSRRHGDHRGDGRRRDVDRCHGNSRDCDNGNSNGGKVIEPPDITCSSCAFEIPPDATTLDHIGFYELVNRAYTDRSSPCTVLLREGSKRRERTVENGALDRDNDVAENDRKLVAVWRDAYRAIDTRLFTHGRLDNDYPSQDHRGPRATSTTILPVVTSAFVALLLEYFVVRNKLNDIARYVTMRQQADQYARELSYADNFATFFDFSEIVDAEQCRRLVRYIDSRRIFVPLEWLENTLVDKVLLEWSGNRLHMAVVPTTANALDRLDLRYITICSPDDRICDVWRDKMDSMMKRAANRATITNRRPVTNNKRKRSSSSTSSSLQFLSLFNYLREKAAVSASMATTTAPTGGPESVTTNSVGTSRRDNDDDNDMWSNDESSAAASTAKRAKSLALFDVSTQQLRSFEDPFLQADNRSVATTPATFDQQRYGGTTGNSDDRTGQSFGRSAYEPTWQTGPVEQVEQMDIFELFRKRVAQERAARWTIQLGDRYYGCPGDDESTGEARGTSSRSCTYDLTRQELNRDSYIRIAKIPAYFRNRKMCQVWRDMRTFKTKEEKWKSAKATAHLHDFFAELRQREREPRQLPLSADVTSAITTTTMTPTTSTTKTTMKTTTTTTTTNTSSVSNRVKNTTTAHVFADDVRRLPDIPPTDNDESSSTLLGTAYAKATGTTRTSWDRVVGNDTTTGVASCTAGKAHTDKTPANDDTITEHHRSYASDNAVRDTYPPPCVDKLLINFLRRFADNNSADDPSATPHNDSTEQLMFLDIFFARSEPMFAILVNGNPGTGKSTVMNYITSCLSYNTITLLPTNVLRERVCAVYAQMRQRTNETTATSGDGDGSDRDRRPTKATPTHRTTAVTLEEPLRVIRQEIFDDTNYRNLFANNVDQFGQRLNYFVPNDPQVMTVSAFLRRTLRYSLAPEMYSRIIERYLEDQTTRLRVTLRPMSVNRDLTPLDEPIRSIIYPPVVQVDEYNLCPYTDHFVVSQACEQLRVSRVYYGDFAQSSPIRGVHDNAEMIALYAPLMVQFVDNKRLLRTGGLTNNLLTLANDATTECKVTTPPSVSQSDDMRVKLLELLADSVWNWRANNCDDGTNEYVRTLIETCVTEPLRKRFEHWKRSKETARLLHRQEQRHDTDRHDNYGNDDRNGEVERLEEIIKLDLTAIDEWYEGMVRLLRWYDERRCRRHVFTAHCLNELAALVPPLRLPCVISRRNYDCDRVNYWVSCAIRDYVGKRCAERSLSNDFSVNDSPSELQTNCFFVTARRSALANYVSRQSCNDEIVRWSIDDADNDNDDDNNPNEMVDTVNGGNGGRCRRVFETDDCRFLFNESRERNDDNNHDESMSSVNTIEDDSGTRNGSSDHDAGAPPGDRTQNGRRSDDAYHETRINDDPWCSELTLFVGGVYRFIGQAPKIMSTDTILRLIAFLPADDDHLADGAKRPCTIGPYVCSTSNCDVRCGGGNQASSLITSVWATSMMQQDGLSASTQSKGPSDNDTDDNDSIAVYRRHKRCYASSTLTTGCGLPSLATPVALSAKLSTGRRKPSTATTSQTRSYTYKPPRLLMYRLTSRDDDTRPSVDIQSVSDDFVIISPGKFTLSRCNSVWTPNMYTMKHKREGVYLFGYPLVLNCGVTCWRVQGETIAKSDVYIDFKNMNKQEALVSLSRVRRDEQIAGAINLSFYGKNCRNNF